MWAIRSLVTIAVVAITVARMSWPQSSKPSPLPPPAAGCNPPLPILATQSPCNLAYTNTLQALALAVSNHGRLCELDLSGNFIGDAGASLLLPVLDACPQLYRLHINHRVSRPLMNQILGVLAKRRPAKKKRSGGRKKTK